MRLPSVRSAEELAALVDEIGFLPFFAGIVEGFSLEECTPKEYWFAEGADGPWEWKGPAIRASGCAYGKLFRGGAGYVSRAWYPRLACARREGLRFAESYAAGLVTRNAKLVYDALDQGQSLLSRDLKWRSGCPKKAFDGVLTRLQMQGYVVTVDFEYLHDRFGHAYGWGLARYDTPEHAYGAAFTDALAELSPEEARGELLAHLAGLWPNAPEKQLARLIAR